MRSNSRPRMLHSPKIPLSPASPQGRRDGLVAGALNDAAAAAATETTSEQPPMAADGVPGNGLLRLQSGARVELWGRDVGFEGSWYSAEVVAIEGKRARVAIDELLEEVRMGGSLRCIKPLRVCAASLHCRPRCLAAAPHGFDNSGCLDHIHSAACASPNSSHSDLRASSLAHLCARSAHHPGRAVRLGLREMEGGRRVGRRLPSKGVVAGSPPPPSSSSAARWLVHAARGRRRGEYRLRRGLVGCTSPRQGQSRA